MNRILHKNNKTRLLHCMFAVLVVVSSAILFTGCEDSEIYGLIDSLAAVNSAEANGEGANEDNNEYGNIYSFKADVSCDIDVKTLKDANIIYYFEEPLDVIPSRLDFSIKGDVSRYPFEVSAEIAVNGAEDSSAKVYIKNNELFFELNDTSRIVADSLLSMGFVDIDRMLLFREKIEYDNGTVLCFDISGFDLSYFDEHIEYAAEFIVFDSSVEYETYNRDEEYNIPDIPEQDDDNTVYFEDIKRDVEKELLGIPGYRYEDLVCVLSTENEVNYMNIIGIKESGEIVKFDKIEIACDLSDLRTNSELFESLEILPLRYIFEMLGKKVIWNEEKKMAVVSDGTTEIECSGKIIDNRMYMGISDIESFNYNVELQSVGDYIEFSILLDTEK